MGGRNGAEENEADNGDAERSAHLLHRADDARRRNTGVLLGNVAQHARCAGTWRAWNRPMITPFGDFSLIPSERHSIVLALCLQMRVAGTSPAIKR
jgi:hypothetical protein